MNNFSADRTIAICTESDTTGNEIRNYAVRQTPSIVSSFENITSRQWKYPPALIILVISGEDHSVAAERLRILRIKFPDSAIAVVYDQTVKKEDSSRLHSVLISGGADFYLQYPSELSALEFCIRKAAHSSLNNFTGDISGDLKNSIYLLIKELVSEMDINSLLTKALNRSLLLTGSDCGAIFIFNENNSSIHSKIHNVSEAMHNSCNNQEKENKILSWIKKNHIASDMNSDEGIPDEPIVLDNENVNSYMTVPVIDRKGKVIGALEVGKKSGNFSQQSQWEMLNEIARITAMLSENLIILEHSRNKLDTFRYYDRSFRSIIENSPYIVMLVQHNKIKYINKKAISVLGYTKNEILGRNIVSLALSSDADSLMETIKKALNSDRTEKLALMLVTKSESTVKTEIEVTCMKHEERDSIQIIGRDLTSGIEDIVNQSVRLAAAVNSLNSAVTITDMNKDILYVNPAHKKLFGYGSEELKGNNISILFPFDGPSGVSKKIYEAIQRVGWEGERIGLRKNGEVFPAYEKISVVKDKEGNAAGIVSVLDEISERKKLEQALKESEERYRTLVETANTAIIAVDENARITLFNPAAEKLFEYSKDEIMNRDVTVLMPEKYSKMFSERIYGSSESEYSTYLDNTIEFTGLKSTGEEVPLEISISQCRIEGKKIFTAIVMDITERKNLQEQLIQSAKLAAIGELISGVTHEVNNPLAIVMGYAEMMINEPGLDEEVLKSVKVIYNESERARKVIQNLLSFARQHNPDKQKIDINELLDKTLALADYELRKNKICINRNYSMSMPAIMADPNQLQQVLLNLIINAQHALTQNSNEREIMVGTEVVKKICNESNRQVDRAVITISDNGPGIPKKTLSKIFDPFFTTKPVNEGTGLGLSVSHGIVSEHGGNIHAESTEGEGTTFFIELPV